jgi:hypothetical protein
VPAGLKTVADLVRCRSRRRRRRSRRVARVCLFYYSSLLSFSSAELWLRGLLLRSATCCTPTWRSTWAAVRQRERACA